MLRATTTLCTMSVAAAGLFLALAQPAATADSINPQADFKAFRDYFTQRFPNVPLNDFVNGPYSMDADLRKQWEAIEDFPPYQFAVEKGQEMFATPFKNGKTYGDCFPDKGIGIRQNYPYFDEKAGEVVTLELALNRCRQANGEQAFSYIKDDMAALTAYMAFTSRGKPFAIKIPNDPRALAAYRERRDDISIHAGANSISPVQAATYKVQASISAPKCWRPRSAFLRRCRSTVPNGAAWERSAAVSSPAIARCAACHSNRRTRTIATSNITSLT